MIKIKFSKKVFLVAGLVILSAGCVFTAIQLTSAVTPNPGHSYLDIELPADGAVWSGLNADTIDGLDSTALGGGGNIFDSIVFTPQTSPPSNPERGEIYFDNGINTFMFWDGGNWKYVDSGYMGGLIDYIGSTHTRKQCIDAGGAVTSISGDGTNTEVCKFTGANISCVGDWSQATNWQKYNPSEWGGDSCGGNKSTAPSIFSNQHPTVYSRGSLYGVNYCRCEDVSGVIWFRKEQIYESSDFCWIIYGVSQKCIGYHVVTSTNNTATNRVEIGCK